jgi:hypothetical protein
MQWLTWAGAVVCKPLFESPDFDLVVAWGERLERVQVKTSTCFRNGRYEVMLATRGGNQSWSGLVKRLDPSRCDALFVHTGSGRRWYIPVSALGGSSGIRLAGPKYSEYEVECGTPLPRRDPPVDSTGTEAPTLHSPPPAG